MSKKIELDPLSIEIEKLGDLSEKSRTKIGVIRALFVEIDRAQYFGQSLKTILEKMTASGFNMPSKAFQNTLARVRNERGISRARQDRAARVAGKPASASANQQSPQAVKKEEKAIPQQTKRSNDFDLVNKSTLEGFGKPKITKPE
jgi:hypothetical protein